MKMQQVIANAFRKHGKWYTEETFEVAHDDYLPVVWKRAEDYLRDRFNGDDFHFVVRTPGHEADHPALFLAGTP